MSKNQRMKSFSISLLAFFFLVDISPDAELITAYYLSESIIHVNFD